MHRRRALGGKVQTFNCTYWKIFRDTNCSLNSFKTMPFAISPVVWLVNMTKIVILQLKWLILSRFAIWLLLHVLWLIIFTICIYAVGSGTFLRKSCWVSVGFQPLHCEILCTPNEGQQRVHTQCTMRDLAPKQSFQISTNLEDSIINRALPMSRFYRKPTLYTS